MSSFATLTKAFEEFSKRLRLIEDIPLKISSVHPLDSGDSSFGVKLFLLDIEHYVFIDEFLLV